MLFINVFCSHPKFVSFIIVFLKVANWSLLWNNDCLSFPHFVHTIFHHLFAQFFGFGRIYFLIVFVLLQLDLSYGIFNLFFLSELVHILLDLHVCHLRITDIAEFQLVVYVSQLLTFFAFSSYEFFKSSVWLLENWFWFISSRRLCLWLLVFDHDFSWAFWKQW